MSKRGQGGIDIATLLILITLFIFFYMILLPVEEREDLLGPSSLDSGNRDYLGNWDDYYSGEKVLLSVSPGQVYEFDKDTIDKEIFPIALFSKIDEEYLILIKSLDIGFKSRTLPFNKPEGKVEDLKLFFFVPREGKLKIKFNSQTIFSGNIDSSNVPIDLPVAYLKDVNLLEFDKGFFSGVKLSDLKLRFGVLKENTIAKRTFVLTNAEKEGLKKAELSFFINCLKLEETGRLKITLNDRVIRDDVVFCDVSGYKMDINKDYLKEELNTLDFEINKGDYRLEDVELSLEVKQKEYPKYEFEVEDEDYDDLDYGCGDRDCLEECEDDCDRDCETSGCFDRCLDDCEEECEEDCGKKVILEMTFGDEDEKKKAAITINEDQFNINTNEAKYKRDITKMINRGANFIKIIPQVDFEIETLKIYLPE